MEKDGEVPKAIRICRVVRWSYQELETWANTGCPKQEE